MFGVMVAPLSTSNGGKIQISSETKRDTTLRSLFTATLASALIAQLSPAEISFAPFAGFHMSGSADIETAGAKGWRSTLHPTTTFEEPDQPPGDTNHHTPNQRITVVPAKLRHGPGAVRILKVHAIDPDHKGEGDEDGSDDSEHSHRFVGALADA